MRQDKAVVGVHLDDDAGDNSGSACVFVRTESGWSRQVKLTASDSAEYDLFGLSVEFGPKNQCHNRASCNISLDISGGLPNPCLNLVTGPVHN